MQNNPEIPLLMNPSHIRDINHEKSPDNIHYHGLKPEFIKQIPNELADPVMIYDLITPEAVDRENAVCIVTKLKDGDKLTIIISVKANQVGDAKYYDVTLETQKLKEKKMIDLILLRVNMEEIVFLNILKMLLIRMLCYMQIKRKP